MRHGDLPGHAPPCLPEKLDRPGHKELGPRPGGYGRRLQRVVRPGDGKMDLEFQ